MSRKPNPPGACPLPHPIPACAAGGCWHVAPGARPKPTSALLARWGIGCLPDYTSEEIAAQTVAALQLAEELLGAGPVQRIVAPERPPYRPWVAEGVREAAPEPERSIEDELGLPPGTVLMVARREIREGEALRADDVREMTAEETRSTKTMLRQRAGAEVESVRMRDGW